MKIYFTPALLLITLTACVFSAAPDYEGLPWQVEEIKTADGFTIKARRYVCEGCVPVILQHGTSGNHSHFDLPLAGDSFARFLATRDFDVWVTTNRGHGKNEMSSTSPFFWRWNADDLAIYDVAAIVETVNARTGQEPFYVGHSLGGATALMYLQGIHYNDDGRVVSDEKLAVQRNSSIRGFVNIAGPIVQPEFEENGGAGCCGGGAAACLQCMVFPLPKIQADSTGCLDCIGCGWLAGTWINPFLEPDEISDEQAACFAAYGSDPVSPALFSQMMDTFRDGTFHEDCDGCDDPYVYSYNLDKVTAPALMVAGIPDIVRPEWVVATFERLGSEDRTLLKVDHGHMDELFGIDTPQDTYQPILLWLTQRR